MSSSNEDMQKLIARDTALQKHIAFFAQDNVFSPATVTAGLSRANGSLSFFKGPAIAAFNAIHSGNVTCPFGETSFAPDPVTGFGKMLHLGTTRIYNAEGKIDEAQWEKFKEFAVDLNFNEEPIIRQAKLHDYLTKRIEEDPEESTTGRYTSYYPGSHFFQCDAAKNAWNEAFDRLTSGWIFNEKLHDYEPYMSLELVRLFFENSEAAFKKAAEGELPMKKPHVNSQYNSNCG